MKRVWLTTLALAAALAIAPAAKADTFYFDFYGAGLGSGGGSFTATSLGGGLFNITGGSITIGGSSATIVANLTPGSLAVSSDGEFYYDNILNPSGSPTVDSTGGILFLLSNGNELEIYSLGGNYYANVWDPTTSSWLFDSVDSPYGGPISLDISLSPEPSSLLLLATGLLALAGGFLWKTRKSAVRPRAVFAA